MGSDYTPEIRGVARRLATQGITVYPSQASALNVGLLGATTTVGDGANRAQLDKCGR